MSINEQQQDLTTKDLLFLQKHIKMGEGHLKSCLSQAEFESIFRLVKLPEQTEKKLSSTVPEVAGQVSLLLNMILSSILGAWLGISSLFQLQLTSKPRLIGILAFSTLMGGVIGLQSILFRRRTTKQILGKRKLKELEIQIVEKICRQREKELKEKRDEIVSLLKDFNIPISPKDLADSQANFQKLCLKLIASQPNVERFRQSLVEGIRSENRYDENTKNFKKIAQKLSLHPIQPQMNAKTWIQTNFNRLVIEAIPTLFGGVSSLFVYIGGTSALVKEIGIPNWISFFNRPDVKNFEFYFVFCVSLYFFVSFVYLNVKAFKRDKEIEKIEAELGQEEKRKDFLDDQLLKVKEFLNLLKSLYKR